MMKRLKYDLVFIVTTGILLVLLNEFADVADGLALYLYLPIILAFFVGKEVGKRIAKGE